MDLTSSDLELLHDDFMLNMVGIVFPNVAVPPNATITNAFVRFIVDEVNSDAGLELGIQNSKLPLTVNIYAERTGNALKPSAYRPYDLSLRPPTLANVTWDVGSHCLPTSFVS
jgi:hypothetical protein